MRVGVVGVDLAAGPTAALSGQDPIARRVADVNCAIGALDTVLVAASPLARSASEGGGGQEADGDEGTSEVHFVVVELESMGLLFFGCGLILSEGLIDELRNRVMERLAGTGPSFIVFTTDFRTVMRPPSSLGALEISRTSDYDEAVGFALCSQITARSTNVGCR